MNHVKGGKGGVWREYGKVRKVKIEVGEQLTLKNLWFGKTTNTNNVQKT
jgi:hypothetical protein